MVSTGWRSAERNAGILPRMIVAVAASLVGLLTVLLTLYREESDLPAPAPAAPEWDLLPTPSDINRVAFPMSFPGYQAVAVDATLDNLAAAYGDLLAVVTPEQLVRARGAAARRLGRVEEAGPQPRGTWRESERVSALTTDPPSGTDEALRLEATLAAVPTEAPDHGTTSRATMNRGTTKSRLRK